MTRWCGRGERGQVTGMLVLFTICLVLAVVAVTDVSAAYLRRQAVTSLADGAALAATDAAAAATIYGDANDEFVAIDEGAATAAVRDYLQRTGALGRYRGLRFSVSVPDGRTVRVALAVPFRLPVRVPGVARTVVVHSTGSSVMPIY